MEPVRLTVPSEGGGVRLDSFLAASLPELTRSAAARLIETGQVTVDGGTASKSARLSGGEAGEAVSSYAGTHSCQTAAHCFGCWPCLRSPQCYPRWGSPAHYRLEEGAPHYC